MSVKNYFLKEPFIFDFNSFARQTFSLVAVVAFICALFLFSGAFLDATAEGDRAETMPVAAQTEPAATEEQATEGTSADGLNSAASTEAASAKSDARDNALAAISGVLGDFVGITPFNTVTATSWDNLRLQVNNAGATPTTINVPTMTSLGAANANAIVIPANANITIRSTLPATNNVITQATVNQRHFTVNGTLTLENVIICGGSVGTFTHLVNNPDVRGGINVAGTNGHLILANGSVLRNNTAQFGGAVHIATPARMTMQGGTVSGNAAEIHGGGIYLTGTAARLDMNDGEISSNRIYGRQFFAARQANAPYPLPANTWWTWPIPNAPGGATYPARYDFPQGQSRGGGGVAVRAGASMFIETQGASAQNALIRGNFAERGGGIYVTGTNSSLDFTHPQGLILENVSRHAYHRVNSSTPAILVGGQADGQPIGAANGLASGGGGGVHIASGARFDMTTGQISRNIGITHYSGGGGGVAVIGANTVFNMSGNALIGGTAAADANRCASFPGTGPFPGPGGGNVLTLPGGNVVFHPIMANPAEVGLGVAETALGAGAGVHVAQNATMNMIADSVTNLSPTIGHNATGNSAMGGGIRNRGATVVMRDNARIVHNNLGVSAFDGALGGRGGGVSISNLGVATANFRMYDTAHIAYNRVGSGQDGGGVYISSGVFEMRNDSAVRNHRLATGSDSLLIRNGAGINATGGLIRMFDLASVHHNEARESGGGIRLQNFGWPPPLVDVEMNGNSSVRNNIAGINGGGVLVEATGAVVMNNNSSIRDNTATTGNGGGVHVASTATGDDGRYGLRINSGSVTGNTATGAAPNGRGGGIFTTRHLYRSPLVNNPLLDPPFSSAAYTIYDNLRIADSAIFANNNARFISGPPTGDQLVGALPREGYIANVEPSAAANIPGANNRLLNNLDINYNFDGHDFWFFKEDMAGNPLPGVTFELRQPNGQLVPGSPAGTPAGTADGQRVSLSNGLVGFPRAMNTFGAASNYSLAEISGPAGIIIPNGSWSFNMPNRFVRNTIADTAVLSATNVSAITRSSDTMPDFFTRGTDGQWRVFNANVATKSFFKTDMSIYDSPPNSNPPILEGAVFRLYRYTPQSASTAFAGAVPAPSQPGYNYWTHIPVTVSAAHLYTLDFGAWNVPVEYFGPAAKFHLVETVAPANFELPPGQWRFMLEPAASGLDPVITITSQGGTNPAFVQIGTDWFVGNADEFIMIPTGLFMQRSSAPFFIILGGAAVFVIAKLAVRHRKSIEELPFM